MRVAGEYSDRKIDDYTFKFPQPYGTFLVVVPFSSTVFPSTNAAVHQVPSSRVGEGTADASFDHWYRSSSNRNNPYNNPDRRSSARGSSSPSPTRTPRGRAQPYYYRGPGGNQLPTLTGCSSTW